MCRQVGVEHYAKYSFHERMLRLYGQHSGFPLCLLLISLVNYHRKSECGMRKSAAEMSWHTLSETFGCYNRNSQPATSKVSPYIHTPIK